MSRTSMEHNDENCGHGSSLMGAIFMANRTTRQECLRRKIFGLPYSQGGFVKKVKAGMILFQFEYEERKLYGVYEATSDGAMNIVPEAYATTGNQFPAQIRFKTLWVCKPLTEDEFGDAIKENYYKPHKFNFGLSYEQVLRLIRWFSSRMVNLRSYQYRPYIKINKMFEKSRSAKSRLTEIDRSLKFVTNEGNADHDVDSRYPGPSGLNNNYSMYYENREPTLEHNVIHHRPLETQSTLMHLTSQSDRALRGSFPGSPSGGCRYFNTDPRLEAEQPPIVLGTDDPSVAQKFNDASRYSGYDQALYCRSQSYPSQSDPTIKLPPPNYLNITVSSSLEGVSVPPYVPSCPSIPFVSTEGYTNFLPPSNPSFPDHCYDSSTSKIYSPTLGMFVSKETEHLPPMPRLNYCYDSPEASQLKDGSIGERYWRQRPPPDYIPLSEDEKLVMSKEPSHFLRCPQGPLSVNSSESQDENDYCFKQGSEHHPTTTNASLYSDTTRASVFSRLSMAPKARGLEDKVEVCVPDVNSALEQLVELVTQRRNRWTNQRTTTAKTPKRFIPQGDEQSETVSKMELDAADSFIELEPHTEEVAEENFEPPSFESPCLDFKRRSEAQMVDVGTETGGYDECGKEKQKRRKLVRPSFSDMDACSEANIDDVQALIKDGDSKRSAEISDSSVRCDDDRGNEGSLALETGIRNAEVMNTKGEVDGSKDCGGICTAKEPLQELAICHTSVIDVECTGTVESLTFSQSALADERVVSVQDNECGDKKHDGIDEKEIITSDGNAAIDEKEKETITSYVNAAIGEKEKEMIATDGNAAIDKKEIASDGNADKCSLLPVTERTSRDLKEVGPLVETFHLVDDKNTALLAHDSCKAMNSYGNDGKVVIIDVGNKESRTLDSNINSSLVSTAYSGSGGKEEHSFCVGSNNDSILSADIKCEGIKVGDDCGVEKFNRNDEKDTIVSDGNGDETFSLEIYMDCSNTSSGKLKEEEKSGEKVYVMGVEDLASPFCWRSKRKRVNVVDEKMENLKKGSFDSNVRNVHESYL